MTLRYDRQPGRFRLLLLGAATAFLFLAVLFLLPRPMPARAQASIIYVDAGATAGAGNGSSWAEAYTNLQDALAVAEEDDEIWVAAGVYYPDEGMAQTADDRESTFQLRNGVALYGGFAGVETARSQRDWEMNLTVLSGDIGQDDAVDANGVLTDTVNMTGPNSYHVVTGNGTDNTAVLDGFTVNAGQADDSAPTSRGGGLYNSSGNPTLTNLTFRANSAASGGGLHNSAGNFTLDNVKFSNNMATSGGGGLYNGGNNVSLTNVTFSGNRAPSNGGGFTNGIGANNVTLTNVSFNGNHTNSWGGGMYNAGNGVMMVNALFTGNRSEAGGGGLYNLNGSMTLINTTFSGNSSFFAGAGVHTGGANVIVTSSILWNNIVTDAGSTGIADQIFSVNTGHTTTVSFSIIQDGLPDMIVDGGNNLTADPHFVDPDGPDGILGTVDDNLRLQVPSPAMDAGNNNALPADESDLDGDGVTAEPLPHDLDGARRVFGDVVDMGAYEIPYVDLHIDKSVTPAVLLPGQPLTYTLTYSNSSEVTAGGVIITDVAPALLTQLQITSSGPAITATGSTDFAWQVADLAPKTGGVITITGRPEATLTANATFTNTATISSTLPDDTPGDNQSAAAATVTVPTISFSSSSYQTGEADGTTPVTVTLDTANPYAGVTLTVTGSDGTATAGSDYLAISQLLTIPAGHTQASFDVVLIDDLVDEVNGETVTLSISSPKGAAPAVPNPATLTIVDDDTAGINAWPTDGLVTTEAGGADTFTVTLNSEPTAAVTLFLTADDTSEATVNPSILSFDAGNWNEPQTVTVTGVDDELIDGDVAFTIDGSSRSSDPFYAGLSPGPLLGTNKDDDGAGVTVTPTNDLVTTETGGTDTLHVLLDTRPTGAVTVTLASSNPDEGAVSPATLLFNAANWNEAQDVTVTGVDDAVDDGDVAYTVDIDVASEDGRYDGINVMSVAATNVDDDTAGITVTPAAIEVAESGETAGYEVALHSQPTAMVLVTISENNQVLTSPAFLVFNAANWSTPRSITVRAKDDDHPEGAHSTSLQHTLTTDDPIYNELPAGDVAVRIKENDFRFYLPLTLHNLE